MDTGVSVDKAAHLTNLKSKRSFFESCLHLSRAKKTKVTSVCGGATLAVLSSNLHEIVSTLDLANEVFDVCNSLLFATGDGFFAVRVVGIARSEMLLENVTNTDLGHFFELI